jgi:hypothetical protein
MDPKASAELIVVITALLGIISLWIGVTCRAIGVWARTPWFAFSFLTAAGLADLVFTRLFGPNAGLLSLQICSGTTLVMTAVSAWFEWKHWLKPCPKVYLASSIVLISVSFLCALSVCLVSLKAVTLPIPSTAHSASAVTTQAATASSHVVSGEVAFVDVCHHILLVGLMLVAVTFLGFAIWEIQHGRPPMIESQWGGIGGGAGGWRMSNSLVYLLCTLVTGVILGTVLTRGWDGAQSAKSPGGGAGSPAAVTPATSKAATPSATAASPAPKTP